MNPRLKKTLVYGAIAVGVLFGLRACNSTDSARLNRANKSYAKLTQDSKAAFVSKNRESLEQIIVKNPEISLNITKLSIESGYLTQDNYKAIGDAAVSKMEKPIEFLAYEIQKQPVESQKTLVLDIADSMDRKTLKDIYENLEDKIDRKASQTNTLKKEESAFKRIYNSAKQAIVNAWDSATGFVLGY